MKSERCRGILCLLVLTLVITSCSKDDDPVAPQLGGEITIDPRPTGIAAPWQLDGPDDYRRDGTGALVLSNLAPGVYSLTWGDLAGWASPDPVTVDLNLFSGGTLRFVGVYARFSTVTIEPWPSGLDAPWELTLPGGEVQIGRGYTLLTAMPEGDYTVSWLDQPGWLPPDPAVETQTLESTSAVLLRGEYVEEDFVLIEAGTFLMGSPADEPGRQGDEARHAVTLTRGFYMARHEVTEALWDQVLGQGSASSQLPRREVSWDQAVAFCNALSAQEGLAPAYTILGSSGEVIWDAAANGYRLPTEAEWEYACRAGSTAALASGPLTHLECSPLDANLDLLGWYCGNRDWQDGPAAVGQKQANLWGLFDLHGNVLEWVWDTYRADYENLAPEDPAHDAGTGAARVLRGGYGDALAFTCRAAHRNFDLPSYASYSYGLRVVRSAF
jgi:formylglycine-generating enzyme required for sulfatase activity